jgi:hypothetical protein
MLELLRVPPGRKHLLSIFKSTGSNDRISEIFTTDNTDEHGQNEDFKAEVRVFRVGPWLNFFNVMLIVPYLPVITVHAFALRVPGSPALWKRK